MDDPPPLPPNPLNHVSSRTIKEYYARKIDSNLHEAAERLARDKRYKKNDKNLFVRVGEFEGEKGLVF